MFFVLSIYASDNFGADIIEVGNVSLPSNFSALQKVEVWQRHHEECDRLAQDLKKSALKSDENLLSQFVRNIIAEIQIRDGMSQELSGAVATDSFCLGFHPQSQNRHELEPPS